MKPRRFAFALRAIRRSLPQQVTNAALERLQPAWEAQQPPKTAEREIEQARRQAGQRRKASKEGQQ